MEINVLNALTVNVPDTYFFKASTDRVINLIASVPVTYWAKKRPTH